MRRYNRWFVSRLLGLFLVAIYGQMACAQNSLQTIEGPQGGQIAYGKVDGADTQGAAMTAMLRKVHQRCGERPQIGGVFRWRGTDSVGVFYTAVNHTAGNRQVSGLIVAVATGPHQAEVASVSDFAERFGSSINPMLTKLFSVWHPRGLQAVSNGATAQNSAQPAATANGGTPAPLHKVTLPDNTASVGVPDGWKVAANSGGGTLSVIGPHGEAVGLNLAMTAIDPTNRMVRQLWNSGIYKGKFIYPANTDLVKAFPELLQQFFRANGLGPAELQIAHTERVPGPEGERCVHASGHITAGGKGPNEMNTVLCTTTPGTGGAYTILLFHAVLPNAIADRERATEGAILDSFKLNSALINREVAAVTGPAIQAMDEQVAAQAAQAVGYIKQIGAATTQRIAAGQAIQDSRNATFDQHEENISRNGQGFSNYLLDQTVIRDVQDPDTHRTVWNRTAEAMQKAYPDRIEEVPTSQYINGQDF